MAIFSGAVTLNSLAAIAICTLGQDGGLVYTTAPAGEVVVGGAGVTATPLTGIPLPASQYVAVPGAAARALPLIGAGMDTSVLYGIATTGTPVVAWLTAATGSGT